MIELNLSQFLPILVLLRDCKQSVLPAAVCQGINPGQVYADQAEHPRTALVTTRAGYYFLAGARPGPREMADIARILHESVVPVALAQGENGFILVLPDGWAGLEADLLAGRDPIRIYRRAFTFNPARFAGRPPWQQRIPAGLTLERVDENTACRLGGMACWGSIRDFLASGIGFCVMDGDEMASACYSVFASREALELDIKTEEKYRRRGLASLAASALIEECLRQGRRPNWECFWDNEPSTRLAEALGFERGEDYPVYYWEERR